MYRFEEEDVASARGRRVPEPGVEPAQPRRDGIRHRRLRPRGKPGRRTIRPVHHMAGEDHDARNGQERLDQIRPATRGLGDEAGLPPGAGEIAESRLAHRGSFAVPALRFPLVPQQQGGLTQRSQPIVSLGSARTLRMQLAQRGVPSLPRQGLRQRALAKQQRRGGGIHPGVAPAG